MYTVRKEFKFEAAHVLNSSESKECQKIHGHSYRVEVFLSRLDLNSDGMVEDFKIIKEAFKPVIDKLDHALIVKNACKRHSKGSKDKLVVLNKNPTAENMAEFIYDFADKEVLSDEVSIDSIRVHETDSGYVEFKPDLPYTLEEKTENSQNDLIKELIQIIKQVEDSKPSTSLENTIALHAEGYIGIKRCVENAINKTF